MAPGPMVILIVACVRTEPDICREVRWDADPTLQCTLQRPLEAEAVERPHPGSTVVSARCAPGFRISPRAVRTVAHRDGPQKPAAAPTPTR